jgi:hypothetical protein
MDHGGEERGPSDDIVNLLRSQSSEIEALRECAEERQERRERAAREKRTHCMKAAAQPLRDALARGSVLALVDEVLAHIAEGYALFELGEGTARLVLARGVKVEELARALEQRGILRRSAATGATMRGASGEPRFAVPLFEGRAVLAVALLYRLHSHGDDDLESDAEEALVIDCAGTLARILLDGPPTVRERRPDE